MGSQLTLTNEKIDTENLIPINMEITFDIDNEGMMWNGKAYPQVSSGGLFGGAIPPVKDYKKRIDEIVASQRSWFKASYGRPLKEKITIVDEREKEKQKCLEK
jgi:hypothetical protein